MTLETRRVCVISAAHLKEETWAHLHALPLADWPILGAPLGPDMLMVWACTDIDAHPDLTPDLRAVVEWAQGPERDRLHLGGDTAWDYVILDRDVDPDEDETGLPNHLKEE